MQMQKILSKNLLLHFLFTSASLFHSIQPDSTEWINLVPRKKTAPKKLIYILACTYALQKFIQKIQKRLNSQQYLTWYSSNTHTRNYHGMYVHMKHLVIGFGTVSSFGLFRATPWPIHLCHNEWHKKFEINWLNWTPYSQHDEMVARWGIEKKRYYEIRKKVRFCL